MKQLYKRLPTFAPDYSGAHNVGYEMGGITVLHEPGGCQPHATMLDESRAIAGEYPCFSTALREIDTVVGSDASVVVRVANAVKTTGAKLVVTMSTPISMLVGTDMAALGRLIEKESGVPVLAVQTDGLHFYDEGQSKAYLAMIRRFLDAERPEGRRPLVNVIGATPLDMWDTTSLRDLSGMLCRCGFEAVNLWGYGGPEKVAQSPQAMVNVVASVSALDAARELQRRYGTPYVVAKLFGGEAEQAFCRAVCEAAGLPAPQETAKTQPVNELEGVKKALVIGEQVQSCALRDCLKRDYGIGEADVVSFFRMDTELLEGRDAHLAEEEDLQAYVDANGPYDIIFGDGLFQRALDGGAALYVSMPHLAVSSMLSCFNASNTIGEKGWEYLDELWEEIRTRTDAAQAASQAPCEARGDMFMGPS